MPKVDVLDLNNTKVGELELADVVFGAEVNEALLYEAVRHYLAGKRGGNAQDQDPARSGWFGQETLEAKRHWPRPYGFGAQPALAPWRHGPRTGASRLQLQTAAQDAVGRPALGSFGKAADGDLFVVSAFQLSSPKTKDFVATLKKFSDSSKKAPKVLLVDTAENRNLELERPQSGRRGSGAQQ